MDGRKYYSAGKFINGKNMKGKAPMTLTITGAVEVLNRQQKPVLALTLRETDAKLQLNKGNYSRIEAALGFDTDKWLGHSITIEYDPSVQMAGETVGGVKVTGAK